MTNYSYSPQKLTGLLLIGSLLSCASLLNALVNGDVYLSWQEIITALISPKPSLAHTIIWQLRLPTALSAFCVGGLLALCGALLQIILSNPLADPYILGISSGAACGVLISILFDLSLATMHCLGWCGAMITLAIILLFNRKQWHSQRLLLCGVIMASGLSAVVSFMLSISQQHQTESMLFWLLGRIDQTHIPYFSLSILCLSLILTFILAEPLNILQRGEWTARSLGMNATLFYYFLIILCAILTTTATLLAGPIGFIGLIIPHLLRLLGLRNYRLLLPGCVLGGGSFLCFANTFSQTILSPQQIPVGVVTALIGVPLFLILLLRKIP
ncbi:MAG: iron ABC transporter permease [Legionellales bacterium]|nr:iron ABC transporter permease [Legionellales bacterium]